MFKLNKLVVAAAYVTLASTAIVSTAIAQPARSTTLMAGDGSRLKVTQNAPTLPAGFDANSVRIYVIGGPITFCEGQNYGGRCFSIVNEKIACDLDNCFSGAGDWRNRIRSVRFD